MIKELKQLVGLNAEMIISAGIPLTRKGKKYQCPNGKMHRNNDKHPSMAWDKNRLQFKCFVCGETIDIYDFYRKYHGMSHKEILDKNNLNTRKKETAMNKKDNNQKPQKPDFTMQPLNDKQMEYLHSRGLEEATINHFNLGSVGGNIGLAYSSNGRVTGIKIKKLGSGGKYIAVPGSEFGFFNKDSVKGKRLIITEGEFDAMIVHQCGYQNVVSVGTGANSIDKLLTLETEFLNGFNSIIVLGDNDSSGVRMEDIFEEKFGLKIVKIDKTHYKDCKDINEVYLKHGKEQVCRVISSATISIPGYRDLDSEPYAGLETMDGNYIRTNIKSLDLALNDLSPRMVTLVTGRSNGGKSTLVNQFMVNAIDGGNGVLLVAGEGLEEIMMNNLYRAVIGENQELWTNKLLHRRRVIEPKNWVQEKLESWMKGRMGILNKHKANIKSNDELFETIERLIEFKKTDLVVIDNLMSVISIGNSNEKFEKQAEFVQRCSNLAKSRNIHIVLVVHPNKTLRKGERMEFEHISGNQDIANKADNIISVQRIKPGKNTPPEANGVIEVLKNRYYSDLPRINVMFHESTKTYLEIDKMSGEVSTYGFKFFDEYLKDEAS